MAYKALYRKWRPLTFDDVIGQEHITKTLKNEIAENRLAHAYLFTGTRGTGKTSTAKILSRAINCPHSNGSNPCNECEICKGILNETVMDIIEIDAASNTGVDNIRSIIEQVQYTPTVAKYKVYIIDEVHMLSQGAFNALLKTLEEPPKHVVFILATTEVHKIPATILSRCQRFDFKTISPSDITSRIKTILSGEEIVAEDAAIDYVAYLANGSMRDSLSILDQCLAFKSNNLSYADTVEILGGLDDSSLLSIADFISKSNTKEAICAFYDILNSGKNIDDFAMRILDIFSKIMVCSVTGIKPSDALSDRSERIFEISKNFTHEHIMFCIKTLSNLANSLKFTKNAKTLIEVAITQMSEPDLSTDTNALLQRIKILEDKVARLSLGETVQSSQAFSTSSKAEENQNTASLSSSTQQEEDISPSEVPPWETPEEYKNSIQQKAENAEVKNIENTVQKTVNQPENSKEEAPSDIKSQSSSLPEGATIKKIALSWGEVINRSIKDGELSVYFALKDTNAADEGGILTIYTENEEKRSSVLSNKDKVKEYIMKLFSVNAEIKCSVGGAKKSPQKNPSDAIFDKLDEFSKKFPQNFNSDTQ